MEEEASYTPVSIFVFDPRTHPFVFTKEKPGGGGAGAGEYPPYLSAGGGLQVRGWLAR
jgi:hypothetical protein